MKETLEEVAERLFEKHSNNTSLAAGYYDYMMDEVGFKEASLEINKWQQERSYSEEDMRKAIMFGLDGMYGYQWGKEGQTDNQINNP